jgi:hypothetical protein
VNVNGAVAGTPSTVTCSPAGFVATVTFDLRGFTSRCAWPGWPSVSVTVRWIRYQTLLDVSPDVGTSKQPLSTPVIGPRNGWVWVSWWKRMSHVNALGGRIPSSGSLPVPA